MRPSRWPLALLLSLPALAPPGDARAQEVPLDVQAHSRLRTLVADVETQAAAILDGAPTERAERTSRVRAGIEQLGVFTVGQSLDVGAVGQQLGEDGRRLEEAVVVGSQPAIAAAVARLLDDLALYRRAMGVC